MGCGFRGGHVDRRFARLGCMAWIRIDAIGPTGGKNRGGTGVTCFRDEAAADPASHLRRWTILRHVRPELISAVNFSMPGGCRRSPTIRPCLASQRTANGGLPQPPVGIGRFLGRVTSYPWPGGGRISRNRFFRIDTPPEVRLVQFCGPNDVRAWPCGIASDLLIGPEFIANTAVDGRTAKP